MENLFGMVVPFLVVGVFMWFFMIRPQKKRQEQIKSMLDSLQPEDTIQTVGGLHGVVNAVDHANGRVVIDCEGIYLTFEKRAIAMITQKADIATTEETSTTPLA